MRKQATRTYDAAQYLTTAKEMAAYLEAALGEGDPALVAKALGAIAKARGMTQIAKDSGLGRESLYKALSPDGNPEFGTILKVMKALGIRLHAKAHAA
jgi:probable addiction module antidote protein